MLVGTGTGTASVPPTNAPPITNSESWAYAQLAYDNLPQTQSNVAFLQAWNEREGGAGPEFGNSNNTASFNPLNSTQQTSTSQTVTGGAAAAAGVQQYSSWQDGIAATSQTLQNGDYPAIWAALKAGNASEVNQSDSQEWQNELVTWSGSGYTQVDPNQVQTEMLALQNSGAPPIAAQETSYWGNVEHAASGGIVGAAGAAASDLGSGITGPVEAWVVRVVMAVVGAIFVVIGLIVLTKASSGGSSSGSGSGGGFVSSFVQGAQLGYGAQHGAQKAAKQQQTPAAPAPAAPAAPSEIVPGKPAGELGRGGYVTQHGTHVSEEQYQKLQSMQRRPRTVRKSNSRGGRAAGVVGDAEKAGEIAAV